MLRSHVRTLRAEAYKANEVDPELSEQANQFSEDSISSDADIDYMDYNWELSEQRWYTLLISVAILD